MLNIISYGIIILIIFLIIAIALLSGLAYTFYYKRRAQKTLEDNSKRTNLPAPLVFVVTTLLIASIIGNVFSIVGFSGNKNYDNNNYNTLSIGEISSEYQYIKDEVINGLKAEYIVSSKQSNDFIIYYAKINDAIKDTRPFLPNYIVYIEYNGDGIIEDNNNIKLSRSSEGYNSNTISKYKRNYSIMFLSSHEITNLKIEGQIKQFDLPDNKNEYFDINTLFEESGEVLYSFEFEINNSIIK